MLLVTLLLIIQLQVAMAQFEGFFNMFGGQHQQNQQQQQQRSGASQFSAYVDSGGFLSRGSTAVNFSNVRIARVRIVSCSHYLCPSTLDCVERPSDCPCPNAEDIKCLIPDMDGDVDDATVMCVRGKQECAEVEALMKKHSDKRRK